MEMEDEQWRICCSNSSSNFIKYFVTFSICFAVIVFSMVQIINNKDDDNSIYFSMISSILGMYMDSPKLEQIKSTKQNNIVVENHKENTDNV